MSDALVLIEVNDGIAVLTINRPEALNALNTQVLHGLDAALATCEADDDLRCVVITGAGEKSFIAGADIAEMADLTPAGAADFSAMGHRVLDRLVSLPVPVIAAVNGFCLGGGCEVTLACDLVFAGDNAKFGQPEVKLGLIPGFGGTQRLPRRVGLMRATELVVTGRILSANQAASIGLCLDVFPAAELLDRVLEIAATIAKRGPIAVRAAKRTQRLGLQAPLNTANAYEREAFANLFDTDDAREGMIAFVEKRSAHFTNR